ncbi:hypothetical protein CAPTEDRAFT_201727 [Capitella teleta]|uniref:Kinetochore protein SPC25 n=1 Tax=Capitella teleta TaxID=283909 RepID=R7U110_CAPTE|nr:hypothetical protein CAPTEDRAFT_201727 [Capitella teleta]|eukprot:ELT99572.1 hypothetical protein CAPTEDRAFT_201727 [Capitella teleta]
MTKYTLQFEELVKRYEDLKKLKTDAATEVKNKNAELEQHRKQLETAQKDLEQLLRTRETLHEILEKLSAEVKKEESVLREQEKETKESSVELEEALEFFRNRLALQMKKIPDNRLQFVFTCIDKDDPKKPFCFCVKIKADRSYCVSDCVPHVPDFEKLSLKLNETNDFKAFVKAMWKRFKLAA